MKIDESRPMRVLGSFCMGTAALTAVIAWRVTIAALSVPWVGRACTVIVVGLCGGIVFPIAIVGLGLIILSPRD